MNFSLIIESFFKAFLGLLNVFSFLFIPIILFIIIFIIIVILFLLYFRIVKKIKPIKTDLKKGKSRNIFQIIFFDFPKQLAYDIITRDPNSFKEFGIHMITGEQGSGKTMTVVYLLQEWAKKYPKMEVYTNMAYRYENDSLDHWKELITRKNGIYGIANVIDEIKTWFSNKESKDVPPEMLAEICQQRKQKKALIGTVQVFSELAKPFRSQTHYVYIPKTIFGCLTFVRISKAKYYDSENDKFKKYCGFFIFAHNKKLRNAYDTYKKIEKYKDVEFATSSNFNNAENDSHTCE